MKYIRVPIICLLIFLLFFILTILTKIYPVIVTERVSQHPHHFYPTTKRSYYSLLYGIYPFILELPEPTICKMVFINGNIEKVVLGDGTGTTKQNYSGYHMLGNKLYCIK